ncbi:hypothetical protein SB778_41425, partial [Paraburkholderia sp. SIMBA_050]
VSYPMMRRWSTAAAHKLSAPGAQDLATQNREGRRHDRATAAWLSAFLDRWVAGEPAAALAGHRHVGDADQPPLDRAQHGFVST